MRRWPILAALLVAASGCELVAGIPDTGKLQFEFLDIGPGVVSPAFDPSVTHYTVSLGDEDFLDIEMDANDRNATIEVDGMAFGSNGDADVDFNSLPNPTSFTVAIVLTSPTGVSANFSIDVTAP